LYTPSDYLLLDEANRRNLQKKQVSVTRGGETFTTTVYVNPNKKKGGGGKIPRPSSDRVSNKHDKVSTNKTQKKGNNSQKQPNGGAIGPLRDILPSDLALQRGFAECR
jgi:hypothetical protein